MERGEGERKEGIMLWESKKLLVPMFQPLVKEKAPDGKRKTTVKHTFTLLRVATSKQAKPKERKQS